MAYFHELKWEEKTSIKTKILAIYNVLNFISKEVSIGRVPQNKTELKNNIKQAKEDLNLPLSIAFVKMAEKGEIDEVTASENINIFLPWNEKSSYNVGDLRTYTSESENEEGEKIEDTRLYKCLQAHTSQADWTPDVSVSLWKACGINENGIPYWSQPISSADAYMLNNEVMHNEKIWVSDYDYNVWEPGVYGWHVKEEVIE